MNYKLKVNSHTWNKDSNLLFDYETSDYASIEINVSSSGYLVKNDNKLKFIQKLDKILTSDYISSISYKDDEYNLKVQDEFEVENGKNLDEKLWVVIKSTSFKEKIGYRLRESDVIKLGKVMFKVKEVKSEEKGALTNKNKTLLIENKLNGVLPKEKTIAEAFNNNNVIEMNIYPPLADKNKRKGGNPICRICLMDDNEADNPLINPCNCTGSVKYIHLMCIRQWLKSKITSKIFNFLSVHSYKVFECELCKTPFSERVKYHNEVLSLVDYDKPESNYLILESISREKRENKYLYVIHMQDKNIIKLGRSNDSDVRMTDISVSRNHAMLKLFKGDFYLGDNSSKFGTLVLFQNDIIILPEKIISMQSGKIFLKFTIIKTFIAMFTCYKNKYLSKMDYNDHFENKKPKCYKEELENLQEVNTDFSMSSDYYSIISNAKVENQNSGVKEVSHFDNLIYKQIEKDLISLKEELKEEKENNKYITENELDINNNNYKTMMIDNSINKIVLTDQNWMNHELNKSQDDVENGLSANDVTNVVHGANDTYNKSYINIPNTSVSRVIYKKDDGFDLMASYTGISLNHSFADDNKLKLLNKNNYNSSNNSKRNSNLNEDNTNIPTYEGIFPKNEKMNPKSTKKFSKDGFFKCNTENFDSILLVNLSHGKLNKSETFVDINLNNCEDKLIISDNKFFKSGDLNISKVNPMRVTENTYSFNQKFIDLQIVKSPVKNNEVITRQITNGESKYNSEHKLVNNMFDKVYDDSRSQNYFSVNNEEINMGIEVGSRVEGEVEDEEKEDKVNINTELRIESIEGVSEGESVEKRLETLDELPINVNIEKLDMNCEINLINENLPTNRDVFTLRVLKGRRASDIAFENIKSYYDNRMITNSNITERKNTNSSLMSDDHDRIYSKRYVTEN